MRSLLTFVLMDKHLLTTWTGDEKFPQAADEKAREQKTRKGTLGGIDMDPRLVDVNAVFHPSGSALRDHWVPVKP